LKNKSNRQEPYAYGSLGGDDVPLVPAKPAVSSPTPNPNAEVRHDYELALQIGTREVWIAFLAQYPEGLYASLAKGQLNKVASEEARVAATEKARLAEEEKVRLAAEGAKQAEQAKAAAQAKAAEQARVAAEKARQLQQEKVTAAEQARAAAEKVAADKIAAQKAAAEKLAAEKTEAANAVAAAKAAAEKVAAEKSLVGISEAGSEAGTAGRYRQPTIPRRRLPCLRPRSRDRCRSSCAGSAASRDRWMASGPHRPAARWNCSTSEPARSSTPNWQALTRSMRLKPRLHGSVPWLASVATRLMEITASKSPAARAHMLTMRMSARKIANDRLDLK
jgi:hypothetical protein